MKLSRRQLFRMAVVAPIAAVVAPPVVWKTRLWTSYAEKASYFGSIMGTRIHDGIVVHDVVVDGLSQQFEIIRTEFGPCVKWGPLKSATGTVPSRGHDGRHA